MKSKEEIVRKHSWDESGKGDFMLTEIGAMIAMTEFADQETAAIKRELSDTKKRLADCQRLRQTGDRI